METIEKNKMIAEFMGAKFKNCGSYETYSFDEFKTQTYTSVLQYDTKWDWLMPVVEKIESLGYWFEIMGGAWNVVRIGKQQNETPIITSEIYKTKIETAYNAVVSFIQYYNTTQH